MKFSTTYWALSLGLATLSSASPILQSRQDETNSTTSMTDSIDSVLKPETLTIIQATLDAIGINGAIVAYTSPKGDGVLTFGNKSIDGDAITPDTHFALASNSKLFFATTLAWLAEKNTSLPDGSGVFTLDTPLKDFVPDFKMYDQNTTEQITSRDFMSHHSGLPPHNFAIQKEDTPKDWMDRAQYLKPITGFREDFVYSNANFAIMTYVVEVLTGKPYWDILDEYIFKNLNMTSSSDYIELRDSGADISQGWLRQDVNLTTCIAAYEEQLSSNATGASAEVVPAECLGVAEGIKFWTEGKGQEWGAGGNVIASGNDLVKWLKEITVPTVIPASVFEAVETPPFPSAPGIGAGLGTIMSPYKGYVQSIHDGALPGSNSLRVTIRNESVGVFALSTDDSYASTWYQVALYAVLDDLLDIPPAENATGTEGGGESTSDTASNPLEGLPVRVQPPADGRPAPDQATLVGQTFSAPGYAPFTLASIDLSNFEATEAARIPIDFLQIDVATQQQVALEGEVLYADWGQAFANMIFFTHFDGPIYNATIVNTYSRIGEDFAAGLNGQGSAYIGKWIGGPSAVVTDGGIGFFDGFWSGAGTEGNHPVVEKGIEDAAEVFFTRQ